MKTIKTLISLWQTYALRRTAALQCRTRVINVKLSCAGWVAALRHTNSNNVKKVLTAATSTNCCFMSLNLAALFKPFVSVVAVRGGVELYCLSSLLLYRIRTIQILYWYKCAKKYYTATLLVLYHHKSLYQQCSKCGSYKNDFLTLHSE